MLKKINIYYFTVFIASFLLFQIQPIMSKALLPEFGGSYLVWGSCMVFFQTILLSGYLYAHLAQKFVGSIIYSRLHLFFLALPLISFPFKLCANITEAGDAGMLAIDVFLILLSVIALPFFALSTVSLVLQRQLADSDFREKNNPYILYAFSNAGSILALLSYPVIVEPAFTLEKQGMIWWGIYLIMFILHLFITPSGKYAEKSYDKMNNLERIRFTDSAKWILLSASACWMLLAVSNVITFDIASVPLLWIFPLSIYLLTFVLAFKKKPWNPSWLDNICSWIIVIAILMSLITALRLSVPSWMSIILHLIVLFFISMKACICLSLSRPKDDRSLTSFYVFISLGGLIGSMIVSWIMPLISSTVIEYPLGLIIALTAFSIYHMDVRKSDIFSRNMLVSIAIIEVSMIVVPLLLNRYVWNDKILSTMVLICSGLPMAFVIRWWAGRWLRMAILILIILPLLDFTGRTVLDASVVKQFRNFYGVYRIYDKNGIRYLQHGTTLHGRQYLKGSNIDVPLSYYHPTTPIGEILKDKGIKKNKVGMIGLGTGSLASYMSRGDNLRIYELDLDNIEIAKNYFSYLDMAKNRGVVLDYITGDGRLSLRSEDRSSLNILIVDAFSSGSIPVHLLTVDAFKEYFRVIKPGGLMLIHISNRILNLKPIIAANAKELRLFTCYKSNEYNLNTDADVTHWMVLSYDKAIINRLVKYSRWQDSDDFGNLPQPWTDQYCNILRAIF